MFKEAAEAPARVASQLRANADLIGSLAARLRREPPRAVLTIARGSSDNAATYARYLIETRLEILTSSAAPSVTSVFDARPAIAGALCLAISQSGHSPDLLATARAAREGGGLLVAMVNDATSPLAQLAEVVIPLHAGPELSVAATKSFITSLSAVAQLVSQWSDDTDLSGGLEGLPDALAAAWDSDWSAPLRSLGTVRGLYTLGRGPGFGIAQEAALKLKEACGIHAEAFSTAEVRHGPMALIGPDFPVIAFVPDDAGRDDVLAAITAARSQGGEVLAVGADGATDPKLPHGHSALTPIIQIQGFYRLVEALSRARGFDPDRPPHLAKVTQTK
jgi:glucosamine--fructose-6-phosphate aminotransferase (isomerizing)